MKDSDYSLIGLLCVSFILLLIIVFSIWYDDGTNRLCPLNSIGCTCNKTFCNEKSHCGGKQVTEKKFDCTPNYTGPDSMEVHCK